MMRPNLRLQIDSEFKKLIPVLLPEEFEQLEANILQDGCQEPLSVWCHDGVRVLLDGHNRHKICEKHGTSYQTVEVELEDRAHAKLWIAEHQLGRRNLTDDQRSIIANDIREWKSVIAVSAQAKIARAASSRNPVLAAKKVDGGAKSAQPSGRTRAAVAKTANLPERKLRLAQEIKTADLKVYGMVRSGGVSLVEGKKISNLSPASRAIAIQMVDNGGDVRSAVRQAKKETYNKTILVAKPKPLEGTYRIIYADPPWKYVGLNQADEYGHAERHYDCLSDEELCAFRVGGSGGRTVRDLADDNAVLFLWVTSPLPAAQAA